MEQLRPEPGLASATHPKPKFEAATFWTLLEEPLDPELQDVLTNHVRERRWFRGKARDIQSLEILDRIPLAQTPHGVALAVIRIHYEEGSSETYTLPLAFDPSDAPCDAVEEMQLFELRETRDERRTGLVYDPTGTTELSLCLLELFARPQTSGARGHVTARTSPALAARLTSDRAMTCHMPSGEQSNTTVFYGDEIMLKLFRQLEPGEHPDIELSEHLWAAGYQHVPEPLGSLHYEHNGDTSALGIAQRFVPSEGIAWDVTLDVLKRSLDLASALGGRGVQPELPSADLLDSARQPPPETMESFLAAYGPFATLLGERTAELHAALAAHATLPEIAPEPFTAEYQRGLVASTRERIARAFELLKRQLRVLPEDTRALALEALEARDSLEHALRALDTLQIRASRIRCHGDYHLGQILYGENDFTILDFEGEPAQPLELRRSKRSALYDVAGMLRSFHYASTVASRNERSSLGRWSEAWYRWTSAMFLCAYLRRACESAKSAVFLPRDPDQLRALLRLHLIDKCAYELSYELNNRPAWVGVPLAGLLQLAKGEVQ